MEFSYKQWLFRASLPGGPRPKKAYNPQTAGKLCALSIIASAARPYITYFFAYACFMLYPQCRILEAEIAFWLMPVAYTRILFSVSVVFSRLPASILGDFYRAMLCIRGTSHGFVSVRPSVRHKSEFY